MVTMFGWSSWARAFASRRKRVQPLRILRHLGGQHLERYVAAEFRVGRAIHLTHATRAQRRPDLVRSELRARDQCHRAAIIVFSKSGAILSVGFPGECKVAAHYWRMTR